MDWYLPPSYLAGMTVWLVCLVIAVRVLLLKRQSQKSKPASLLWVNAGLSTWTLLVLLTGIEISFALFADWSDAFNMTNISKRWIRRHIDGEWNNAGFRDPHDLKVSVPEGVRRICFVGDSFTVGHGVTNMNDRFTDLVAAALEQSKPGRFVVANLGVLGYEVSEIESLVRASLKREYDIDTVIYVFVLNDIEAYDARTTEAIDQIRRMAPRFFLLSRTYFFNWLYFRYVQLRVPGANGYFPHLVDSYQTEAWTKTRKKIDEMMRNCKQHDVGFRMVIFPFVHNLGDEYPFRPAHAKLVAYCREREIPVLDLEPVLSRHTENGLIVSPYDAHPNERAHKIASDAIQRHLLKDFFQPSADSEAVK